MDMPKIQNGVRPPSPLDDAALSYRSSAEDDPWMSPLMNGHSESHHGRRTKIVTPRRITSPPDPQGAPPDLLCSPYVSDVRFAASAVTGQPHKLSESKGPSVVVKSVGVDSLPVAMISPRVTVDDASQQHHQLLLALGHHLEDLGSTLAAYASAKCETDNEDGKSMRVSAQHLQADLTALIHGECGSPGPLLNHDHDIARGRVSRVHSGRSSRPSTWSERCTSDYSNWSAAGSKYKKWNDSQRQRTRNSIAQLLKGTIDHEAHLVAKKLRRIQVADMIVALVILLNAVVLGFSVDNSDWKGFQILEFVFTSFFLLELLLKLCLFGVREYFVGDGWMWNYFDLLILLFAVLDCLLYVWLGGGPLDLSSFTIVKVARLGRLARLVRLLQFPVFNELKSMIQGVFAGLRVLFWAVILLISFIYILAIVMRQMIEKDVENIQVRESFKSMPSAMLTLFRCFTDGCSASNGTPLQTHLFDSFGLWFIGPYMIVVLFVTIGLFNLIMANFVDNVLEKGRQQKLEQRVLDRNRMENRLRKVIKEFARKQKLRKSQQEQADKARRIGVSNFKFFPEVPSINTAEGDHKIVDEEDHSVVISREKFCELLAEPDMQSTLAMLDIESSTRDELFDVLDADMSGELEFDELIHGLMSLRGPAEKKDVVGALLCIRASQQYLREMQEDTKDNMAALFDLHESLKIDLAEQIKALRPRGLATNLALSRVVGNLSSKDRENSNADSLMTKISTRSSGFRGRGDNQEREPSDKHRPEGDS